MVVRKQDLTRVDLLNRLNELCAKNRVLSGGEAEEALYKAAKEETGLDYDYSPYFNDDDVIEYNDLSFIITTTASTARDRNRLVRIFKTIAQENGVRWNSKRSVLTVEHSEGDPGLEIDQYWDFVWHFQPN